MPFGKRAADRSENDDVWIKGFRDPATRVRFLMEPDDFHYYKEHYDRNGVGYFPCEGTRNCVGCSSQNEEMRKRNNRYAVCAIDAKGYQQVFKMGPRLYGLLQSRFQREEPVNTITNRDHTIVRTGKDFNEISYFPEPGAIYPVEFEDELYDIEALLEAKYAEELKLVGSGGQRDDAGPDVDSDPEPDIEPAATNEVAEPPADDGARIAPKKRAPLGAPEADEAQAERITPPPAKKAAAKKAAPKAQAQAKAAPAPLAEPEQTVDVAPAVEPEAEAEGSDEPVNLPAPEYEGEGGTITRSDFDYFDPAKAGTSDLREFLTGEELEFPQGAPRSRLVKIAQAYINSFPEF